MTGENDPTNADATGAAQSAQPKVERTEETAEGDGAVQQLPVRHAYSTPAVQSRLTPGKRPTLTPRVDAVDVNDHARLLAATSRSIVGLIFVIVALHFLPIHMITPIMTGMGILMVVTGSYAAWLVGRSEPRLMGIARIVVWGTPILTVAALVATTVFGAGAFSPAIRDLVG